MPLLRGPGKSMPANAARLAELAALAGMALPGLLKRGIIGFISFAVLNLYDAKC